MKYFFFVLVCIFFVHIWSVFAAWEYVGPSYFGFQSTLTQSVVVTPDNKLYFWISVWWNGYPVVYDRNWVTRSYLGNTLYLETNVALSSKLFNDGNQLYMGYSSNSGGSLAVMEYLWSGSRDFVWGKWFSPAWGTGPDFDIDQYGNIYTAFRDGAYGTKVNTMKRDGASWGYLWWTGTSLASAGSATIAVASDQEVYLGYRDNSWAGWWRPTVRKRNWSTWSNVWPVWFWSGNNSIYGTLLYSSIGELFYAYSDSSVWQRLSVVQWTGSAWQYVWWVNWISSWDARNIDIKSNSLWEIYVIYTDVSQSQQVVVQKRDWSAWSFVWSSWWISVGSATITSLAINKYNKVFVAYRNWAGTAQLVVQSWEEPYSCFNPIGDECVTDVGAWEVTVLSIRSPLESLSLFYNWGWQNNLATTFSGSYTSLGQSGYFIVEDSAWDDSWYYTTVESSDLTWLSWGIIPAFFISMSASDSDIVVLDWLANSDLHVNISSWTSLDSPQTLFYRAQWYNNNRVGTYGVAPTIYIDIPPYQPLDTYSWTITHTLYYND